MATFTHDNLNLVIGPAIPDWAFITQSNIDKFASLFIGRAIGTVTGVLVAGKIVDLFDNMVLLGIGLNFLAYTVQRNKKVAQRAPER